MILKQKYTLNKPQEFADKVNFFFCPSGRQKRVMSLNYI